MTDGIYSDRPWAYILGIVVMPTIGLDDCRQRHPRLGPLGAHTCEVVRGHDAADAKH